MKRTDRFLEKIGNFINSENLMVFGRKYLVALSGGADSVALLVSLYLLGYDIEAAHCNFKLRGNESDRDESFCIDLCTQLGVRLHITHFNTREYAKMKGISVEMAARDLRYAYFHRLCVDISAYGICVGHHIEDSVETLLINLIRGTGINGLTGISARNGNVLRPLLCVSRKDIEQFLKMKGIKHVEDSSNFMDDVVRNKIRLNIMPMIRNINPSADNNISRTARRLAEANKVFEKAIVQSVVDVMSKKGVFDVINIDRLVSQVSPECTLFAILSNYGFSPQQIEDISKKVDSPRTGIVFESTTHRILFDRGLIIISGNNHQPNNHVYNIPEEGVYKFAGLKLKISKITNSESLKIEKNSNMAFLDFEKLKFPLKIRTTKPGDRFVPFGMKGTKLISDYLTDRKLSLFEKELTLVMTDCNNNVVWLIGQRIDDRYKVTPSTKIIFKISLVSD